MGRRSYSGEKWRKEQARKKEGGAKEGDSGGGPPIDWDAMVGGPDTPPPAPEEERPA